jgi:hypothetical protein
MYELFAPDVEESANHVPCGNSWNAVGTDVFTAD